MPGEHGRRHVPRGAVRPVVVVVIAPVVDDAAHVAETGEEVLRQALVAEAAVEAFDVGVLHRLAGWMKRSSTPLVAAHRCTALPANSGPLSVRITFSSPRSTLT